MTIIDQLKRHEGFRAKPYQCSEGVWTFGYGLTFISKKEAEVVLLMRVEDIRHALSKRIAGFDEARQNVLINMAFNLGLAGLFGFKKMWAALDKGDYETAAKDMLDSKWSRQVGQRANELADIMRG